MILEFDLFFSQLRLAKYFNQYIWNLAIDFFFWEINAAKQ
jgi:hypothetical protein